MTAATPATPRTPATTPRDSRALALTLDPVGADTFFEEHWEREPLHVARAERGRFDNVLSMADAERIVCASGARVPAFRLAKDGTQLPLGSYTEDIPWHPGRFAQIARVDRVAEEYARGATIILQALQLHWHAAALYCRGLEAALGWPVQANAYLTPATAQGFSVHHDVHDVFVLQVAGSKRWRLYEPAVELPLRSRRWSAATDEPGPLWAELTLEAGDTLFVPRGWPHEAAAGDADSLHLTIGLHPPTRLDAIRAALERSAGDDVELRRSLGTPGELPGELVEQLGDNLDPDALARAARRRFVDTRRPIVEDALANARAADSLGAADAVERRPTVIADVELSDAGAVLRFEGKLVRFPAKAAAAVAAAYGAAEPFSAGDLPGPLGVTGRVTLVRRLVREGFLRVPVVE